MRILRNPGRTPDVRRSSRALSGAGLAVLVLGLSLACGSGPRGHREIASGGGPVVVVLTGPMQGRLEAQPMSATELDGEVGLYDPQPEWDAPDGRWMAKHTVATPGDPDPWQLDIQHPVRDLTWSGPCGAPESTGGFVLVFPDGPGALVNIGLPLDGMGLVQFEGRAPILPGDGGTLKATGTWTLQWCGQQHDPDPVGPGTAEVTYTVDRATVRHWEAPKRGAF